MLATSAVFATIVFMVIGFWLMDQMRFLVPYKPTLFEHGTVIAVSASILFLNLLAFFYWLNRKFFLKDSGRKLVHLDKQLRTSNSDLSEELATRLES